VVHASELTLVSIWSFALFVAMQQISSSNNASAVRFPPRVATIINGAQHHDPTYKNSRSTRRERRNQQSVSIIV